MSGQATGWVLRHGPHPDDIDRGGKKYGQRARGYRSVLLTIADAANRDGEHAHPGIAAMCAGSLYSRRQVQTIEDELVAEGWVTITEHGGGRGRATVYTVNLGWRGDDGERAQLPPTVADGKGATTADQSVRPDEERVQPGAETAQPGLHPNVLPTEPPNGETPTSDLMAESRRLCDLLADLIEQNGSKRPTVTAAWVSEGERMLRLDGREPVKVERCIRWCQADTFWRGNILSMTKLRAKYDQLRLARLRELEQQGPRTGAGAPVTTSREAPEGRVQL